MKVQWVKDDQPVEPSERILLEGDTVSSGNDCRHWLQFEELVPEDSGTYFCEASNQHGDAYTCCRLKVIGKSIYYQAYRGKCL